MCFFLGMKYEHTMDLNKNEKKLYENKIDFKSKIFNIRKF